MNDWPQFDIVTFHRVRWGIRYCRESVLQYS